MKERSVFITKFKYSEIATFWQNFKKQNDPNANKHPTKLLFGLWNKNGGILMGREKTAENLGWKKQTKHRKTLHFL